jgi:RNA polymerase sigma factor (sigma-70 family)
MDDPRDMEAQGPFDARYLAFLETITQLRPRLHRYCSRMTGSVMDGEDVVQDALFEGYRKLDQYDESRPLAPWLFKIAHNRCIDLLRKRGVRVEVETAAMGPDSMMPANPAVLGVGQAVERLVIHLPPKERACVLLKDVFDYTLEEITELVGSTVDDSNQTGFDDSMLPSGSVQNHRLRTAAGHNLPARHARRPADVPASALRRWRRNSALCGLDLQSLVGPPVHSFWLVREWTYSGMGAEFHAD